jgi:uncharacterized membrane protein YeaQ/YmgE (transglycosylase-associated protein family)
MTSIARRILQISFGIVVGVMTRLLLPGHVSIGMTATVALSLAGAVGGGVAAERLLPGGAEPQAGFAVAALGALAALLVYGFAA